MPADNTVTTADFGSSAAKAVAVLEAFRGASAVLGVTEIATRTGLSKSTVHRLLAVLVEGRLVQRNGNRYMLGRALFELSSLVPDCRPRSLREAAIPAMSELYATTRATRQPCGARGPRSAVHGEAVRRHIDGDSDSPGGPDAGALHRRRQGDGRVLHPGRDRRAAVRPLTALTPRSILDIDRLRAHLRAVRETGLAHDREESQIGARSIAVPILRLGAPAGALSVTVRATESIKPQVVEGLQNAADQISRGLRTAWAS